MRSFDILLIESIVNHPACLAGQFTEGNKPQTYRAASDVGNLQNYFLFDEGGGWGFLYRKPGIYECQFAYLPEHRGPQALAHSRQCFDYMRGQEARLVYGWIAKLNTSACRFVSKLGCTQYDEITGDFWLNGQRTAVSGFLYDVYHQHPERDYRRG